MRIGILTQKLENNYGGILQNYALQTVLRRMGHSPITIDFRPGDSYFWYVLYQLAAILKKVVLKRDTIVRPYSYYKTNRSIFTTQFIKNNINTTKRLQFISPLIPILYRFNAVIVGSDQVWRSDYNVLRNTYLSFVRNEVIKIAYAASFGLKDWTYNESQTQECSVLASRFRAISTRERNGVLLCNKYLNVNATHVLDPTMLLNQSEYESLCSKIPVSNDRILFSYILDLTDEKKDFIIKTANKMKLVPIIISAEDKLSCSIESWLAYYRDSEFIITDSFHGTVFSLIFHKPFNCLLNESRGNDRFESLLTLFEMTDRVAKIGSINTDEINWQAFDKILSGQKELSINFLKSNLYL